jgi:hypothetical protein
MRRLVIPLLGLSFLSRASTPAFVARRIDDGTFELRCRSTLWECLAHFDDLCRESAYQLLSAHDDRRPVDVLVGSYQRQARTSDARLRCGRPATPPADASARTPATARACVPGATQACVGPAACAGGQSCLSDGSGFGACDCGPSATAGPERSR